MNLKLIRFIFLSVLSLLVADLSAQKFVKDDYRAEIGLNGGGSFYIGDANSTIFANTRPSGSGYFRYKFNPRLALRTELSYATVAATGINDNSVWVGDVCGEFNFFDLEQNPYKRFSKTFSPYIFTGLCMMTDVYNGQLKTFLPELGLTFGLGFKVKLNDKWNFNAQWSNRLMFVDNLEGYSDVKNSNGADKLNNPYGLNGSNMFNNDFLSNFTIGISYNIWQKSCDCGKHKF